MLNAALWQKLQAHRFDDPAATRPFSVTLANDQGWSAEFTADAIEEYRRFLYVSQVSDLPVTPSVTIDKVWHHHLTYTSDYWDVLCRNVLGRKLHHYPGNGSKEHQERYRRQFENTLRVYKSEFGTGAPTQYWGSRPPRSFVVGLHKWLWVWVPLGGFATYKFFPSNALGLKGDWSVAVAWFVFLGTVLAVNALYNARVRSRKGDQGCGGVYVEYAFSLSGDGDRNAESADCGGGGCGGD